MSEVLVIGTGSETVYGTQAGAIAYLTMMLGTRYDVWRALSSDDQKRTLATVRRFLDRYSWIESANTFAKRDALADFVSASYELAAVCAEDPSRLTSSGGDGVSSVSGGGVSVSFFSPESSVSGGGKLPDVVGQLLGKYLATVTITGGYGVAGDAVSAFDDDSDYDRNRPY